MKTALKETWRIVLRTLPWELVYMVVMLLVLPGVRTYAFENPWYFASGIFGALAVLCGLIFAAQLVLIWVRAEKEEEEAP